MTMLKNNHITFSLIFVCLVMVSPMAKAQLGGLLGGGNGGLIGGLLGGGNGGLIGGLLGPGGLIGGLLGPGGLIGGLLGGGGGGGGGGGLGDIGGLLGLINIQGIVRCSVNGNASAPAFPNAGVQLRCGGNNAVSTATTDSRGLFSMLLNPVQFVLSTLLSDCNLAVMTPLSTCNAALPTGTLLRSSLAVVGETVSGLLRISNVRPTGFIPA